jgi:hypothetical protein
MDGKIPRYYKSLSLNTLVRLPHPLTKRMISSGTLQAICRGTQGSIHAGRHYSKKGANKTKEAA